MLKGNSSVFQGIRSFPTVIESPSSSRREGYSSHFYVRNNEVIISESVLDTIISLLMVFKVHAEKRIFPRIAHSAFKEAMQFIYYLASYKSLHSWSYCTVHLPPSSTYLSSLKFELLHYSVSEKVHTLKLRCLTFQEQNPDQCISVVKQFMSGYLHRSVTVYPVCKWRIRGSPSLYVSWIITFNRYIKDGNTLRNSLLKESWNDYYEDCHWCEKRISSPSYLDYLLRVTGSFSSKLKCHRKKHCDDVVDDVVFCKYADKDTRESFPVLPVVVLSSAFIIFLSIIAIVVFLFPVIKKYLF